MIANQNFKDYTEEQIKQAYDRAKEMQLKLALAQKEEKDLIERRTELELRLRTIRLTLQKAENLVSQMGVALGYLTGDLQDINVKLKDMKEKQYLGIKIIKAQEEERHRLSREIHDGPAQTLANIVLKTEYCERLIDIDKIKAKEELKNLRGIIRESLQDVRKVIYDLRPMSLDDLGLIPTIERLIEEYIDNGDIFIEFKRIGNIKRVVSVIELAIFRIIQESLTNIVKHSKAGFASVIIEYTDDKINVTINDDGIGFDKDLCKEPDENSGFGLLNMSERVELLNGKFDLTTKPGFGTKVFVSIPINVF